MSAKYVINGYKLGTWVQGQRYIYKKDKLPYEKVALLEKISSWSWKGKKGKKK